MFSVLSSVSLSSPQVRVPSVSEVAACGGRGRGGGYSGAPAWPELKARTFLPEST